MPSDFSPETTDVQRCLGDVVLEGEIARGGQKVVFHARSTTLGDVAVKIYKPGSPADLVRAEREVFAAQSIASSHFPRVHLSRRIVLNGDEVLCIYEEFLHGQSLRQRLTQSGRLSPEEALRIATALLAALELLQASSLVHRDIKPENIYLTEDGRVVLLDLGIARHLRQTSLTADDALFGPLTPGYGAPEQIKNEKRKISIRTDIFALGVVMYECLAGQNPFAPSGTLVAQILQNTLTLTPPRLIRPNVPARLADVVARCLEKATHRRFPSPSAMLTEIIAIPG